MSLLRDSFGRKHRKLRVSLTDACQLRCLYCMPEQVSFEKEKNLLRPPEYGELLKAFQQLGVEEIRLTGGEPTLRRQFMDIVEVVDKIPFKKISLTSNGVALKKYLGGLAQTKLKAINFSLDSLNPKTFKEMSRRSFELFEVLDCIKEALRLKFKVKINVVVMRGLNDHELEDFVRLSQRWQVEVRFLEVMKIGIMKSFFDRAFVSANEMEEKLRLHWDFFTDRRPHDSTSYNYLLSNGAQVGFIASESKPFCGGCSRLRLSATGEFRPCLMNDSSVPIRNLRGEELFATLSAALYKKKWQRGSETADMMYGIGG